MQLLPSSISGLVLSRKLVVSVIGTGLLAVSVACSSSTSTPTATQRPASTATQQPTSTPEPTATASAADPTATPTQDSTTPANTPVPTPPPPVAPSPTPAAPTPTSIPGATATPVPQPTQPPTPVLPTSTPVVTFTPGVSNTVELSAAKDNTLYQSSIGATSNGAGQGLFAGRTNNNSLRRALVQFDIASAIPAGATIESVELTLSVTRTATQIQSFSLHRVTADWGEGNSDAAANEGGGAGAVAGDATWTHTFSPVQTWQTPGGDFVSTASAQLNAQGNNSYTWDSNAALVSDVQSWIENPGSNFGWIMLGDEVETKSAKRFGSRESNSESARPRLVITFTPPA